MAPGMSAIWKYVLEDRETWLEVPFGAQVVHADEQYGKLCLWMLVNPNEARMETKVFKVVHTGEKIFVSEVKGKIRTVLMKGGSYVAHVFEVA